MFSSQLDDVTTLIFVFGFNGLFNTIPVIYKILLLIFNTKTFLHDETVGHLKRKILIYINSKQNTDCRLRNTK